MSSKNTRDGVRLWYKSVALCAINEYSNKKAQFFNLSDHLKSYYAHNHLFYIIFDYLRSHLDHNKKWIVWKSGTIVSSLNTTTTDVMLVCISSEIFRIESYRHGSESSLEVVLVCNSRQAFVRTHQNRFLIFDRSTIGCATSQLLISILWLWQFHMIPFSRNRDMWSVSRELGQ